MSKSYITALLVIAACIACSSVPSSRDGVRRLSSEEQRACVAAGGKVERVLIGAEGCVRPTTDGGKYCSDKSQCQGACNAPFGALPGEAVAGKCASEVGRYGCRNHVNSGQASGEFCFD